MKSRPQFQQSETLVEQAQRVMRESRKLLEERAAQLRQQEQFREQRAMIAEQMLLGDTFAKPL